MTVFSKMTVPVSASIKMAERADGAKSVPPAALGVSSASAVDAIKGSRIQRVMNDAIIRFFTRVTSSNDLLTACSMHVLLIIVGPIEVNYSM